MFFYLFSALLIFSPANAKEENKVSLQQSKVTEKVDSSPVGKKLKILPGKYKLEKGPEDQCYSGSLEVAQIAPKKASILLGGRPLAVKLDVNPVVAKVTEGDCTRLTKSELRENTALQTLDVTCKDATKNYSLGRKVTFEGKKLSYGVVYKGTDKSESVSCELSLIE